MGNAMLRAAAVALLSVAIGLSATEATLATGYVQYIGQGATGPAIPTSGPSSGTTTSVDPFLALVVLKITGSALSSVTFSVAPISGSLTRPITATYSGARLQSMFANGYLYVPVFGLYAAPAPGQYPNLISFNFVFVDSSTSFQEYVTTPSYDDPCTGAEPAASGSIIQARKATADLGFDYFLLKNYCSRNSPAIVDADGYLRWVSTDPAGYPASVGYNATNPVLASYFDINTNSIFRAIGGKGLDKIDMPTGQVLQTVDFSSAQVSGMPIRLLGDHNIDPGYNGTMLVGVDTSNNFGAALLEISADGKTVTNTWDFAAIVSAAMIAGGDMPTASANCIVNGQPAPGTSCPFVNSTGLPSGDWFHQNASTFYVSPQGVPTLVTSSRENFVMAVDYFPSANGQRKIQWILGDTSKEWYQKFPSLRKYAILTSDSNHFPIGQHGISFDADGNLLLLSDGLASAYHYPTGIFGPTAVYKYSLNLQQHTANLIFGYTDPLPPPGALPVVSPICGSAYAIKSGGTYSYLVDFASQNFSNPQATSPRYTQIQGLRGDASLVFDMKIPATHTSAPGTFNGYDCSAGWNALPLNLSSLSFR